MGQHHSKKKLLRESLESTILTLMKQLILAFCLLTLSLSAAHFENLVELTVKVEDAGYNLKIKSLRFNGLEVPLEEPDLFKPRKVLQYQLQPGRYLLNWSTEKSSGHWQEQGVKVHERILVLESGDNLVRVGIKGDTIVMY